MFFLGAHLAEGALETVRLEQWVVAEAEEAARRPYRDTIDAAFEFLHMGYASAMAWLLFVIIMILTVIQLRVGQRWVYYEGS